MRSNRLIPLLLLFGLIPMFLAMPAQQLLVVFAEEVWQVGSSGFGVLQAISGVGGVVGAIWVARSAASRQLTLMLGSGVAFAGLLALFAMSPWFWPAVVLGLLAYSFASVFGTLNNTAVQLLIPDEVRGRVSSFMLMSISLPLLGTLPVGALADVYGAPLAVAGACGLGALSVLALWMFSPTLRSLDARLRDAG
jgi:predicted MFS family arabinose efflux permease